MGFSHKSRRILGEEPPPKLYIYAIFLYNYTISPCCIRGLAKPQCTRANPVFTPPCCTHTKVRTQKNGCNRNRLLLGRYNELLMSCVLGDTARDVFRARQVPAGVDVEQLAIERAGFVKVFGLEQVGRMRL